MSVNIEMPKLSDTMTEGTLIKWHKQLGDTVEIGDILAEVETDKATMEMEAFDDGVITEILIKEGEKAAIGSVLAVLDGDSADAAPPAAVQAPAAVSPAPATPTTVPAASNSPRTQSRAAPILWRGQSRFCRPWLPGICRLPPARFPWASTTSNGGLIRLRRCSQSSWWISGSTRPSS